MILDHIKYEYIEQLGKLIEKTVSKEFILFKWNELTTDIILEFIKMFTIHCISSKYHHESKND